VLVQRRVHGIVCAIVFEVFITWVLKARHAIQKGSTQGKQSVLDLDWQQLVGIPVNKKSRLRFASYVTQLEQDRNQLESLLSMVNKRHRTPYRGFLAEDAALLRVSPSCL
jgi:hypothetical protein